MNANEPKKSGERRLQIHLVCFSISSPISTIRTPHQLCGETVPPASSMVEEDGYTHKVFSGLPEGFFMVGILLTILQLHLDYTF